jgi:LPS sulfotransferase NodH
MVFDDFLNVLGYKAKLAEILYEVIIRQRTNRTWSEVWQEVSEMNRVEGYFVVKVMFHYISAIAEFIAQNSIVGPERRLVFKPEVCDPFYDFFKDAIWVYIERRDVVAQAVSLYLAAATQIWNLRPGVPRRSRPEVAYDGEKIKRHLQHFVREKEQWQLFFRHYDIAPVSITYEEAAAAYPHYLRELLDRCGLQMVETPRPRRLLKVGDELNEKMANRLRNDLPSSPPTSGSTGGPRKSTSAMGT